MGGHRLHAGCGVAVDGGEKALRRRAAEVAESHVHSGQWWTAGGGPDFLASIMIPFQAVITPLFMLLQVLGLQNSLLGLTLVYSTFQMPLSVFLMRNSFSQVPVEMVEAAEMDGATVFGTLRRVLLPAVCPGIISVALFAFFSSWNEFLAALVLLTDDSKFTLPLFLTSIAYGQVGSINWGALEAGVLVTMAPCVVIFLLLQRYYVRGVVAGALR